MIVKEVKGKQEKNILFNYFMNQNHIIIIVLLVLLLFLITRSEEKETFQMFRPYVRKMRSHYETFSNEYGMNRLITKLRKHNII